MTERTPASNIQSLDVLLAAIRAGMDPAELLKRIKKSIKPSHDHRWLVPWFCWCREAITADTGGAVGERWLDLNDPLEPLRFVKGALTRLAPLDRWLVAALRLAKLARDVSDTVHGALVQYNFCDNRLNIINYSELSTGSCGARGTGVRL